MRLMLHPARTASFRQRCRSCSSPAWSTASFYQRLAFDPRHDAGDQPARLAHLDNRDQCCILFKSYEGPAQVVWLWHGVLHRLVAATMVPSSLRAPYHLNQPRTWLVGHTGAQFYRARWECDPPYRIPPDAAL